jgi:MFS family permease
MWGLLASCQSLTQNFHQMLIIRLLLGVGEAAFSPGVPFYLSFFYRRDELALRAAMQISAAPLASSFAGSLAYLITWLGESSPIASWRVLFLVEGFPSIVIAVVAWSFVADEPGSAWFLTTREQRVAKLRLRREGGPEHEIDEKEDTSKTSKVAATTHRMDWAGVAATLTDPKAYLTAVSASANFSL